MPEKKPRVFHPYLFALYPVLFFYDLNKYEVWFSETWLPMAVALTATLLFLALFRLIFLETTTAGIFVSFCLVAFFFYEAILSRVSSFALGNFILSKDPDLSWSYGIFFILLFIGIKTIKNPLHGFTRFFNIVSVVLITFPLANIALHKLKNPSVLLEESALVKKGAQGNMDTVGSKPDIYYIILDAYGREDVLKEFYGYDNSEFIGFLKDRGFHIARKSRSNYPVTVPSLASSLNMNYVDRLAPLVDQNKRNLLPLNRLIEDNEVARFLKSIGYRYIHFSSGISMTRSNRNADIVEAPPKQLTPFAEYLINKTFIRTFELSYLDPDRIKRKTILHAFSRLEAAPGVKEPTFAFAHMLMPHGPYVFDKAVTSPKTPTTAP